MIDRSKPIVGHFESNYISNYGHYTSQDLRDIADSMDKRKVEHIEVYCKAYYNSSDLSLYCEEKRLETQEEADLRYDKEIEREKCSKEYRRQEFNKLLKEFGNILK